MAGRYLISGAQLGVIKGVLMMTKDGEAFAAIKPVLEEIETYQFIGNSRSTVKYDAEQLEKENKFLQ